MPCLSAATGSRAPHVALSASEARKRRRGEQLVISVMLADGLEEERRNRAGMEGVNRRGTRPRGASTQRKASARTEGDVLMRVVTGRVSSVGLMAQRICGFKMATAMPDI